MIRIFGNFKLDGGFEVLSKHDMATFVISLVLIVGLVVLVITNHFTNDIQTIFMSLIPGVFGYWFGRGSAQGGATDAGNVPGNASN